MCAIALGAAANRITHLVLGWSVGRCALVIVVWIAASTGAWHSQAFAQPSKDAGGDGLTSLDHTAHPGEATPADALAVVWLPGLKAGEAPSPTATGVGLLGILLDQAWSFGLLAESDNLTRLWLDVVASLPVVVEHPVSLMLLDYRARPRRDGGHELAGLQVALVIHTRGNSAALTRRIQHLLNSHTNSEDSTIVRTAHGGRTVFALRDRRLEPWAKICWGEIEDSYVIAVGEGAFKRVAETIERTLEGKTRAKSLAADPWFAQAFDDSGGKAATLAWYINVDAIRHLADSGLLRKIHRVRHALHLGGVERGLWTVGEKRSSVEINAYLRRFGEDRLRPIAGARFLTDVGQSVIPEQAESFAVIAANAHEVVSSACRAYLSSRSPAVQQDMREFWQWVREKSGVSIYEDVIDQLGDWIVIHDYPPHALRLPIARTILLPIKGDPQRLRAKVDQLLGFAEVYVPPDGTFQLIHDPDGIWYIRFGLNGPALGLTDQWLVVSFAPEAVRQNLVLLKTDG